MEGVSFAFECNAPAELIKFQGDWCSDAYLVYLEIHMNVVPRSTGNTNSGTENEL